MSPRRVFRFAASLGLALCSSLGAAAAEGPGQDVQLLFLGVSPDAGLEEGLQDRLPALALQTLPEPEALRQEVFAARLRAAPLSSFVTAPGAGADAADFVLVARAVLEASGEARQLTLGDTALPVEDFAKRLDAAVAAFAPARRGIGFLHLADPAGAVPQAMPQLQAALEQLGFDMIVVLIDDGAMDGGAEAASCATQPLHYALLSGLADRAPFGDADGLSTAAEVEAYLAGALGRARARGCGPDYALVLKAVDEPAQPMLAEPAKPLFAGMEAQLYHETFEARFLMQAGSAAPVQAFLDSCVYCPRETELQARLEQMETAERSARLEAEIWERIKDDADPARLAIYLDSCELCAFREEAEAQVSVLQARAAAEDAEAEAYRAASEARDLEALRAYATDCIACTYRDEAEALLREIEADEGYMAERRLLAEAVKTRSQAKLDAYLTSCTVCDGQDEVAETLEAVRQLEVLRTPCLRMAGLPQFDGPRKLEDIDTAQAVPVCEEVAQKFPDDGLVRTTLGRIAQAAGDIGTARAAYEFGMERKVPAAFGLAAYAHYAPEDDTVVDLERVEELARLGAEGGDWLSQEILTVIYSKDLVPGKTGADAFAIAERVAQEGNPLAQFFTGYYYMTGTGIQQDDAQAEAWLKKAVDQGYLHAYSFLAELHERSNTPEGPETAAELYWTALRQGDATAADRLTAQIGNRVPGVVRAIQQRLREEGLYRGRVDGMAGPGTVSAVRAYVDTLPVQG